MYYVYILELKNGSHYVGYSEDLKKRVAEHNQGKVKTTKENTPVKLVFYAGFEKKFKATKFERYLKEGSGFAFRNKRLV